MTTTKKRSERRGRAKQIVVRVEPELATAIKRAANADGRSLSNYFRALAVERLQRAPAAAA
jgi:hypothetical protein